VNETTSPPHWTESVRSVIQKNSITSMNDTSISSHSQKTSTENSTTGDQPVPTRAWKFLPEKEKPKPAYVFKMAIIPGMPLSSLISNLILPIIQMVHQMLHLQFIVQKKILLKIL
jgi:hypothetical protein